MNTFTRSYVLNSMEKELCLNLSNRELSINEVKSRILEFSEYLNSAGRLSLLHCDKSESEEFVALLLSLKKDIKYTLDEIGHSCNKKNHEYICSECKEIISINPNENFWTSLQNHEHVEYLYTKFLNGCLENVNEDMANLTVDQDYAKDSVAGTSNCEFNENADSGIDNEICEGDHNEMENIESNEEDVNSFRFNFVLRYEDSIESKIYPESLIKALRKIDKIREYTVMKTGPFRAVCLLCSCDIVTKSRISNFTIRDHSIGHRHLRFASNAESLETLRRYHQLWLSLECCYQAHQVYFKPASGVLRCVLCNLVVKHDDVLLHIERDPHKKKVLDLLEKKNNIYHLVDIQVQVYGIKVEPAEASKEAKKEKTAVVKTKALSEKTDSDSSPSSDSKDVRHNIIKSVENWSSENVLDLVPNRFREHLKYIKVKDGAISCVLCKIVLHKDVAAIKKHIGLASHFKASDIKPKRYSYYCEICNIKIPDEVAWNSHFVDGPNKHANMAESRKKKATEYECTKCCTVIYGDDISLTRHLSISSRRDKKSKEMKLPEPVNKLFGSKEVLESTAKELAFKANDVLRYNRLTAECCTRLETALAAVFQGCRAYPFGSRISGLGDQYSDLDVFIDTGGMYTGYKKQDAVSQVHLVRKVQSLLGKHKDEFQDVFPIPTARTPIVKLYHRKTEIECDLSFRHGLSVENTKFLRFCVDLQPITQPFILLLKKWSQHISFTEHISNYALALTAIFYLQVNNYLLSVKKVRQLNPEEPLVINGWETIKYTMPLEQMKTFVNPYPHTVSRLLRDYFAFYAKFNYELEVICPLLGHTVPKAQFYVGGSLPVEMKSYIAQLQSEEPEQFRALSPFCVQDPFDLSHNLTKACQRGTLSKFKICCELSWKRLDALL